MTGRSQSLHDVTGVSVSSVFPQNSNSMTLRISRKEWSDDIGDYVGVSEELHLYFADKSLFNDLVAVLPHARDFVEHEE